MIANCRTSGASHGKLGRGRRLAAAFFLDGAIGPQLGVGSDCFKLTERSGCIDPVLFRFYIDLLRHSYLSGNKVGTANLSTLGSVQRHNPSPVLYALDKRTGIKWCCLSTHIACTDIPMEYAVEFNIRKLTAEKFKPEFEQEALLEIENQLQYVTPYTWKLNREKSIIRRVRDWKQAHGGK